LDISLAHTHILWWPRPVREYLDSQRSPLFSTLCWLGDLAARLNGGALVTLMKIPNSNELSAAAQRRQRQCPWHTASKLGPSGHNFRCTTPLKRPPLFGPEKCNRMQRTWNSTQNLQNATDGCLFNQYSGRKGVSFQCFLKTI